MLLSIFTVVSSVFAFLWVGLFSYQSWVHRQFETHIRLDQCAASIAKSSYETHQNLDRLNTLVKINRAAVGTALVALQPAVAANLRRLIEVTRTTQVAIIQGYRLRAVYWPASLTRCVGSRDAWVVRAPALLWSLPEIDEDLWGKNPLGWSAAVDWGVQLKRGSLRANVDARPNTHFEIATWGFKWTDVE